ncbi:MAG: InlB B-repeat-containing protein [Candidatus Methanoplasma sp.]|jgi:hypothetical protein|nr:InlB B-repeat-containing protein [Candidatus Methanoplasma sp.]
MTGVKYVSTTKIAANVKLIAGWGITVTFDDGGQAGITDGVTSATWAPGGYEFVVLEGTVFDKNYDSSNLGERMPLLTLSSKPPTSWYDGDTHPYTWYTDGVTAYAYSVTLIPEFGELFQFNMLGGNLGIVYVAYFPTDSFQDVLNRLYASINNSGTYIDLTKTGLYYKTDGTVIASGEKPNVVWYKDDGVAATDNSTSPAIVYVGNQATLVPWVSSDSISSASDAYAYIRWLADVTFARNVASPDAGTTANPSPITGIDEGAPFASLTLPSVPQYNTANDKTFKGWYNGATQYSLPDGTAYAGAPNVTGSVTITAKWGVEVKFYYTGTLAATTWPSGTDAGGSYVIIEVGSDDKLAAKPSITKTNFTNGHLLWYDNGFSGTVPTSVDLLAPPTEAFNPDSYITVNQTVYARWYADVTFTISGAGSGFFSTLTKYLLEGSKLSDLPQDLNPYAGDTLRGDWEFIGWFKAPASATDYEDLGTQYYRTAFDYLPNDGLTPSDSASLQILGNVTLTPEYVVLVNFDPGYDGATPIDSQYLRVGKALPSSGPRFTAKPSRLSVTFTGWRDVPTGNKYTVDVPDSDVPNTRLVEKPLTLTATWLVVVKFYDLNQYLSDGLQIALSSTVVQRYGPDLLPGTNDDYFEMPEGTTIRQFIINDPYSAGKTFVSWFAEQEQYVPSPLDGLYQSGDAFYGLSERILNDVTLTAGYGYSVHFNTNGGTPSSIPDQLVIQGQSITLPESPAKGRLTFSGWHDGSVVHNAGFAVTPSGVTTYSAKWLVVVKIYDGVSMTPVASMQWDEDDGPGFDYDVTTSPDYDNKVVKAEISWTDAGGLHNVIVEKFIDRYDSSASDWVSLYSVFDGWADPFTGNSLAPTADLKSLFTGSADSAALFATWKERARFYDDSGLLQTDYVESGAYLGAAAPAAAGWADLYNPTSPLNPSTYRIRDSEDFLAVKFLTVTFEGNGGTPAQQVFSSVVSGQMLGLIGPVEPTRGGMYFAGWYSGVVRYSFTDRLYEDVVLTAQWQSTPVERYTIFATAYADASISPSGMIKVIRGDTVSFDFNTARSYAPAVLVDGQRVNVGSTSTYVFSNVVSDHSIEVRAENSDLLKASFFLTVNVSGNGEVLYSTDGGTSFMSYSSPLPIYEGASYLLEAVPRASSYFDHWSGDASGGDPRAYITPDASKDLNVTANFGGSSGFFKTGELGILNLICVILAIAVGLVATAVARKKDDEGTGTGRAMRLGALFVALIAVVLFLLTQGFGGEYVPYDKWSVVMVILTVATLALALASTRYDHKKG